MITIATRADILQAYLISFNFKVWYRADSRKMLLNLLAENMDNFTACSDTRRILEFEGYHNSFLTKLVEREIVEWDRAGDRVRLRNDFIKGMMGG